METYLTLMPTNIVSPQQSLPNMFYIISSVDFHSLESVGNSVLSTLTPFKRVDTTDDDVRSCLILKSD